MDKKGILSYTPRNGLNFCGFTMMLFVNNTLTVRYKHPHHSGTKILKFFSFQIIIVPLSH
jgi:hypothetical protein